MSCPGSGDRRAVSVADQSGSAERRVQSVSIQGPTWRSKKVIARTHLLNHDLAVVCGRLRLHSGMRLDQGARWQASTEPRRARRHLLTLGAERQSGCWGVLHVDAAAGATLAECACAIAGVVVPDLPPRDMSRRHRGGAGRRLGRLGVPEHPRRRGKSSWNDCEGAGGGRHRRQRIRAPRMRITHSVGRRLLATTRHV
jgi:hypothetical protein